MLTKLLKRLHFGFGMLFASREEMIARNMVHPGESGGLSLSVTPKE
ncbi:MAG: hypothetical protein NVS4B11_04690 [Ktedonobacteraceae bacterium]